MIEMETELACLSLRPPEEKGGPGRINVVGIGFADCLEIKHEHWGDVWSAWQGAGRYLVKANFYGNAACCWKTVTGIELRDMWQDRK